MERYVETERVYRDTRALLSISIQICPVYDKKGRGGGYRDMK